MDDTLDDALDGRYMDSLHLMKNAARGRLYPAHGLVGGGLFQSGVALHRSTLKEASLWIVVAAGALGRPVVEEGPAKLAA